MPRNTTQRRTIRVTAGAGAVLVAGYTDFGSEDDGSSMDGDNESMDGDNESMDGDNGSMDDEG